jgi:hypothetical protein
VRVSSSAPAQLPAAGQGPLRGLATRARLPAPWPLLVPVLAACAASAVALAIRPRTVDLAAHVYRAVLFRDHGFTLWDGNWYGGHHTPAYSVLFPPLGALLGPFVVGALEAVIATGCFAALAGRHWGSRTARWGSLWFAVGSATILFTGRVPFGLGLMFGTAALLAQQRGHRVLACVLAVCCPLASPVAGLFLGIAAAALLLTTDRRGGLAVGVSCAVPMLVVAFAFQEGAHEPFDFSTFWPVPLVTLAFAYVIPRAERTLRVGAVIYALSAIAFKLVSTPMGGNAVRLGGMFGGAVLACALTGRWPRDRLRQALAVLLFAAFFVWQWSPALRDTRKALEDPATSAAYYRPLLDELDARAAGSPARLGRIEVPFTRSHWESAEVARRYPLARGWERQVDIPRNPIFYGGRLTAATYGAWLAAHGVGYVAVAASKPDYSAFREIALIDRGLPYLRPVWRSRDWRLYAVTLPHPLVVPRGNADMRLASLGIDSLAVDVRRPGTALVRVQWSQYWKADGACVAPAGEWTALSARRPGVVRMHIDFALGRVFSRGRRC